MLVLSRKEGERIKIGDNITLIVVRMGNDRVRLGIEAPQDIAILRGELVKHPPVQAETQRREVA